MVSQSPSQATQRGMPPATANHSCLPTSLPAAPSAATTPAATAKKSERLVESFQNFISLIFSVSIFGASTFAIIAGQMADPADIWKPEAPRFELSTVRSFLAVAWLCFVLAIAVAGYSSSILTLMGESAAALSDEAWMRMWNRVGLAASVVLHLLLVTAFLFLSLALVAYVGTVGWVAVGFCSAAMIFVVVLSTTQVCRHFRLK